MHATIDSEMESNSYLHVDLVAAQNDWDVLANTLKITVPVRDVLIRDTGRHVEHDDTALALNVVAVAKTTKLLLSSSVPDVEADRAKVGEEVQWVNLYSKSG